MCSYASGCGLGASFDKELFKSVGEVSFLAESILKSGCEHTGDTVNPHPLFFGITPPCQAIGTAARSTYAQHVRQNLHGLGTNGNTITPYAPFVNPVRDVRWGRAQVCLERASFFFFFFGCPVALLIFRRCHSSVWKC